MATRLARLLEGWLLQGTKEQIAEMAGSLEGIKDKLAGLERVKGQENLFSGPPLDFYIGSVLADRPGTELYSKIFGGLDYTISRPGNLNLESSICRQMHFGYDEYRYWAAKIRQTPGFHRKQWEYFYISQALSEHGKLSPGNKGLGLGVGREPLPSLFASFGAEIVATDQSLEEAVRAGWAQSNEYSIDLTNLNDQDICPAEDFARLVSFQEANMNMIPASFTEQFDFCWSSCAFEHLGSLENGLKFVENSINTLKPGGVAVHTTEFNVSSNADTLETPGLSLYRRRDMEALVERLSARGYSVAPSNWEPTDGFAETIIDIPPYKHNPHIRLMIGNYVCTSVGIIVQKPI